MTVEASIVLPLFLFFFLNMGCAIEMIRLHGNIQLALWQTGSRMSVYGYVVYSGEMPEIGLTAEGGEEGGDGEKGEDKKDGKDREDVEEENWWKDIAGIVFASTYVKAKVIDLAGREYLDSSPLKKGAGSLQLWESEVFGSGDEIDLIVTYAVAPWSGLAGFFHFRMANRYYAHIWNGYRLPEKVKEVQIVFVTENGSVYHLDRNCTHLQLSVSQVSSSELAWVKNRQGRRYQACEKCVGEAQAAVWYITSQGDRYHYTRSCPGLKRTVHAINMEDASAYKPCSRCGGGSEK